MSCAFSPPVPEAVINTPTVYCPVHLPVAVGFHLCNTLFFLAYVEQKSSVKREISEWNFRYA